MFVFLLNGSKITGFISAYLCWKSPTSSRQLASQKVAFILLVNNPLQCEIIYQVNM